jgi:AraC-like DNA-binding protein
MHYFEVLPDPRLLSFVRCFWGLRGAAAPDVERVLPDGCCELVIHCGDRFTQHGPEGVRAQPRELFIGPSQQAIRIQPGRWVDVVGVRFRPGGAVLVVDGPLSAYREWVLSREDAGIRLGFDALDALMPLPDRDRIALLEAELLVRARTTRIDRAVAHAQQCIAGSSGAVRIDVLAADAGMTSRQLQRRFQDRVGLTPKTLSRLVRLQRAIALARSGGGTLARIAATAGFADQAHFNRQFRAIAGVTPSEFFREQNAYNDLFAEDGTTAASVVVHREDQRRNW